MLEFHSSDQLNTTCHCVAVCVIWQGLLLQLKALSLSCLHLLPDETVSVLTELRPALISNSQAVHCQSLLQLWMQRLSILGLSQAEETGRLCASDILYTYMILL